MGVLPRLLLWNLAMGLRASEGSEEAFQNEPCVLSIEVATGIVSLSCSVIVNAGGNVGGNEGGMTDGGNEGGMSGGGNEGGRSDGGIEGGRLDGGNEGGT